MDELLDDMESLLEPDHYDALSLKLGVLAILAGIGIWLIFDSALTVSLVFIFTGVIFMGGHILLAVLYIPLAFAELFE